jgi:coenzyme Q-binding protein COQ10
MPTIKVQVKIKKPANEVYKILKDMESFPSFMRDIKTLKIIRRLHDGFVTMWEVDIEGAPVSWKEEDIFDDTNFEIRFSMSEGNYKAYRGYWQIQDRRHNCRLTLSTDFDWGIPILEAYVGKALEKKARRGLLGMLQAIKKKVEKTNV